MHSWLAKFAVRAILWYQRNAPERLHNACVFEPTCSNFALLVLDKYGFIKGIPLIIQRLFLCHPPNGGFYPVPE